MEFVFPPGRPTICGIDHEALRSNLRQIRHKVGSRVKILCMVKANGYGHGAAEISRPSFARVLMPSASRPSKKPFNFGKPAFKRR